MRVVTVNILLHVSTAQATEFWKALGKSNLREKPCKHSSTQDLSWQLCQQRQAGQQQESILAQHKHHQTQHTALAFCCCSCLSLGKHRQGRNNTGVISISCFSTLTRTYQGFFISHFCENVVEAVIYLQHDQPRLRYLNTLRYPFPVYIRKSDTFKSCSALELRGERELSSLLR